MKVVRRSSSRGIWTLTCLGSHNLVEPSVVNLGSTLVSILVFVEESVIRGLYDPPGISVLARGTIYVGGWIRWWTIR